MWSFHYCPTDQQWTSWNKEFVTSSGQIMTMTVKIKKRLLLCFIFVRRCLNFILYIFIWLLTFYYLSCWPLNNYNLKHIFKKLMSGFSSFAENVFTHMIIDFNCLGYLLFQLFELLLLDTDISFTNIKVELMHFEDDWSVWAEWTRCFLQETYILLSVFLFGFTKVKVGYQYH